MSNDSSTPEWQKLFMQSLVLAGLNPRETDDHGDRSLRTNFVDRDARLTIALVKQQIGIAFTGDDAGTLEEEGWSIIHVPLRDMEAFANVMSCVMQFRRELRKSEMTTPKTTSRAEEMLIDKLLGGDYNLPMPDRDYTFRDSETGREITVPDMAWPKLKVCVYVDGGWWHHGKDIVEELQMDDKEKRQMASRVTKRNEKDENNRRYISAQLGWRYITCSAEKIVESDEYLTGVADDIFKVYMDERQRAESEARFGSAANASDVI